MISAKPAGITISRSTEGSGDYSVLSLNRRAAELLDTAFPENIWVRGEIAEVSRTNTRGHSYFKLAQPSPDGMGQPIAVLDCALFAGNRPEVVREFARAGQVFQLEPGMSLRLQGKITIWDRGGRYQFIVSRIDPSWTRGDQAQILRKLVEKLRSEGILEANAELDMPLVPLNVGLITARSSAASEDFLQNLRLSGLPFRIFAAWSPMQGENTSQGVIDAFNRLLRVPDLDVVVLTRGGGSATDLAWFNDRRIAMVISQVPWPVISGIGHETDTTLPDFVSHTSVRTPTQCAEYLVNRVTDFIGNVDSLGEVLHRCVSRRISACREEIVSAASLLSRSGVMIFRMQRMRIDSIGENLRRATGGFLSRASHELRAREEMLKETTRAGRTGNAAKELSSLARLMTSSLRHRMSLEKARLSGMESLVEASSPEKLYRRGWASVRDAEGKLLRSVEDVSLNESVNVRLGDGSFQARTERITREGSANERK